MNKKQTKTLSRIWQKLMNIFNKTPATKQDLFEHFNQLEEEKLIDRDELNMIRGVILVSQMQVRDVMIPRSNMIVLQSNSNIKQQTSLIINSKHSRFPVIGENKDDIKGIVLAKDLLKHSIDSPNDINIDNLIRPTIFVPESKRLDSLLREFQLSHNHLAIVMDEYGGVAGLVTIEDLIEQIIGEIEDEHFTPSNAENIKKTSTNTYLVKAVTHVEEFNKFFNASIDDSYFDTIGGVIAQQFGRLPSKNETITINNIKFKVTNADQRRIHQLEIHAKKGNTSRNTITPSSEN